MTRTYINGVSKLSFNNGLVSFELNDTKNNENGEPQKLPVIELITDPETLHGICSFIFDQLNSENKINKSRIETDAPRKSHVTTKSKNKDLKLTVGKKIASSETPHN